VQCDGGGEAGNAGAGNHNICGSGIATTARRCG
jgi:hypothetical protein